MGTRGATVALGTRCDGDDFYCHKYQVWYRVEDCVYRGKNKTFPGCVNCFQGYINLRCLEKGTRPPTTLGSDQAAGPQPGALGTLLPLRRVE